MPRLPSGLRRVGGAWKDPLYRPRNKPVVPQLTPEQIKEQAERSRKLTERMVAEMNARSGIGRLVDREARVSVEGDTDLNYDNVEYPA